MATHKEALKEAVRAWYGDASDEFLNQGWVSADMEAALRAYLDVRGLVMVPREPTDGMIEAGDEEKISRETFGMTAYPSDVYRAMLAAAANPFKDEDNASS